jgi:hypothetical protein
MYLRQFWTSDGAEDTKLILEPSSISVAGHSNAQLEAKAEFSGTEHGVSIYELFYYGARRFMTHNSFFDLTHRTTHQKRPLQLPRQRSS